MRFLRNFGRQSPPGAPTSSAPPVAAISGVRVVDEHFTPGPELDIEAYIATGDLTGIHHLVRYRWAQEILRSRPVFSALLDLGCGSGYGAFLLAQTLPQTAVSGIDYDPQAVAAACRRFALPNLTFATGDPTDWKESIGDRRFDVVTCFDVLEHVKHRELLLEGVVQHLSQDGWLLFSTPCASNRNNLHPGWVHHQLEYSTASLYDFLRRYFHVVLRSDEAEFPGRRVFEELHERGILYELRLNPVLCREPIQISNPYRA
jgi:2-polyprenyl-3-methyl-5-hydroxy-6-metoxy-1,4-benzoquinol methylase